MADRVGLAESVAIAVGGMVGGGIVAILGVVVAPTVGVELLYFEREPIRKELRELEGGGSR
ncbi:hypothetical protein I7X12_04125 [Halosimplex litoreum]|uniref:AI-2E family transporter n=1 Tax=Halosimplex litoreum TaxID=1198301 RepID=A0A7T3KWD8_9EURY|nr:hypothetical protein [Halosimplex litoreum]QPV63825.1 hypothetical protein I7X12_04125 [Halosimplex litoreum]